MPIGRPSSFTPEVAARICERLAAGESLRSICNDDDMPHRRTVRAWRDQFEDFSNQYARARETGLDQLADETLQLADDVEVDQDSIAKAKLQVDTRKWLLSKLAAKKYGDRMAHDVSGTGGGPIKIEVVTGIHRGPPES